MTSMPPLQHERQSSFEEASSTRPKPPFQILWWGYLVFSICAGIAVWGRSRGSTDANVAFLSGMVVGMLVISVVVAWVAWLVIGRSKLAATIAFAAIAVLGAMGQIGSEQRRSAAESMVTEIEQMQQQLMTSVEDGGSPSAELIEQSADRVARTMERVSETHGAKSVEVGAAMLREMAAKSRPYLSVLNKFQEAGGIDAGTLKSVSDIDQRLELVSRFRTANDELDAYLATSPSDARRRLQQIGAPEGEIRSFMHGLEQNLSLTREIRRSDRALADHMTELLTLLKSNWGRWHTADGGVLFREPGEHVDRYNQLGAQIAAVASEQEALQRQIVANQQHHVDNMKQELKGVR